MGTYFAIIPLPGLPQKATERFGLFLGTEPIPLMANSDLFINIQQTTVGGVSPGGILLKVVPQLTGRTGYVFSR